MILRSFAVVGLVAVLLVVPGRATAGNDGLVPAHDTPSKKPIAGIEERIGSSLPLDLVLRDEADGPITLGACIGGKPTILLPMYFRCPALCNIVLENLVDALRAMPQDFSVGGKFNVVVVSIDPKEHGPIASAKKNHTLGTYGRAGAEAGWHFLTGTQDAVATLTEAVGFRYEYDKTFKEYNHPSGLLIVTPDGRIARYFYNINFSTEYEIPGGTTTLRLSLIEASDGKIGSLLDKVTLLCYSFGEKKGYALNIMRAVQAGGLLTLLLVGGGVALALRRERRARGTAPGNPANTANAENTPTQLEKPSGGNA